MQFSTFGTKFSQHSGITQLMDDLNDGLQNPDAIMLGGGNPAAIPEMIEHFTHLSQRMVEDGSLVSALTNYDGPQGKSSFISALAKLLSDTYGWPISEKNIMLTNGSQCAFFYLFNLFGGQYDDGSFKKILLPLTPEYIGYADSGLTPEIFTSFKPTIEHLNNRQFKYHVDFDALEIDESVAAICASRPTNPTGNVLTDEEVRKLDVLAQKHGIPLIIDNAYGVPFPNIIFEDVTPFWNSNTILCSSLSKLGLPGVRCGIIIASENIITALSNINGIVSLAPCGVGPALAQEMIKTGDLLTLSENVIKPFYQDKAQRTIAKLQQAIPDSRFKIHKAEGAIFLWLWFEGLPIPTKELYQRLKQRGLLVVPGEYFFIGSELDWDHTHECLRMNYVQPDELIERGIEILADEVSKAYAGS
ncbi:valine--pyruvate transaminase [Enterovibrio paralichthyis]|uniref:valine--pyruvate transaminase n=1 Tax=Enterovibrio paralichthyis TaxID=2853805 RepID=UPI001C442A3F|nr:valine--pyruvate transaminase [Enterovibrio paralichthyis]MBV7300598.1 valine--pyruvate transaminase [Enterovibrio paralichthyis]